MDRQPKVICPPPPPPPNRKNLIVLRFFSGMPSFDGRFCVTIPSQVAENIVYFLQFIFEKTHFCMKHVLCMPSPVTTLHPFFRGVVNTLTGLSFSGPYPWLSERNGNHKPNQNSTPLQITAQHEEFCELKAKKLTLHQPVPSGFSAVCRVRGTKWKKNECKMNMSVTHRGDHCVRKKIRVLQPSM